MTEGTMHEHREGLDRRAFVGLAASCGVHLLWVTGRPWTLGRSADALVRQGRVVSEEPWGRLESLADGLWALISTPLDGDRTTLCNGGIVAGRDGVLMVEGFGTVEGAQWMAAEAHRLTGRAPTHVVLTHFHGDHTGGIAGYAGHGAVMRVTAATRDLVLQEDARRTPADGSVRAELLADAVLVDPAVETRIDLGGRTVRVVPREGHTPSDLTVEVGDPSVVFCGDLVWNRMFPNYRDAIPSRLGRDVRALVRSQETRYVPGHGPLADAGDLDRYVALIDDVEAHARRALEVGRPVAEAAAEYRVPEALGDWIMFSPRYYEVAFGAWERELRGSRP
jgi:glyoxylase-like metal-dependent hydrolase (beta-lactamase superfamily II)